LKGMKERTPTEGEQRYRASRTGGGDSKNKKVQCDRNGFIDFENEISREDVVRPPEK